MSKYKDYFGEPISIDDYVIFRDWDSYGFPRYQLCCIIDSGGDIAMRFDDGGVVLLREMNGNDLLDLRVVTRFVVA